MANQYAARLGVLLGIDIAEFSSGVDKAVAETRKLNRSIESEMKAAEKEIRRIQYAVEDYGKEVTAVTLMQRKLAQGGAYENIGKERKDYAAAMLKEAAAIDAVAAADKRLQAGRGGMGGAGMDRYLKQALAYQTTDIVTSLAGGQNPLMVLLQQGGQLRDQFGGFGPLFKGIKEAVTLSRVAFTGLGAAIGVTAFAAYKGSVEFAKLRDDLILTNNFAGVTQSSFAKLSKGLSDDLKISIGDAKDIFGALVASGKVTTANLDSIAMAIANVSKLSGESAEAVAQRLLPSFDGTTSSAKRLNDQYHFLNLEQYKYIEQLNRQGKLQEAAKFTADALNASLQGQKRELGFLESAWSAATKAASGFWNMMLDIGKPSTLQDAVDNARKAMLSASEALMGNMSPMAKANAEKLFQQSVESYKKASAALAAEQDKTAKNSAKKAEDQAKIDNWTKAGGAEKASAYAAEYEKLKADEVFQKKMFDANKFEKVRLESAKRIADKEIEMSRASGQEMGQFSGQQAKIMAQFRINEELKVSQEIQRINNEAYKTARESQITEQDSLDMEKQKMGIYQSNFFITEAEAKLAEDRLKTQQEIAKILRNQDLTPESKDALIQNQVKIGETREELDLLADKLKYIKDVNQAVFQNMTQAIQAFLITGKMDFKNFTLSLLANMLQIQAQWAAMSMMKGFGSIFSSAGGYTSSDISAANSSSDPIGSLISSMGFGVKAAGGFINSPSIVGENGPELFIPNGSGTIIPNQRMGDYGGGSTSITNNYINAIDTKSFEDRLYGSNKAVWAANQYADKNIATSRSRT